MVGQATQIRERDLKIDASSENQTEVGLAYGTRAKRPNRLQITLAHLRSQASPRKHLKTHRSAVWEMNREKHENREKGKSLRKPTPHRYNAFETQTARGQHAGNTIHVNVACPHYLAESDSIRIRAPSKK